MSTTTMKQLVPAKPILDLAGCQVNLVETVIPQEPVVRPVVPLPPRVPKQAHGNRMHIQDMPELDEPVGGAAAVVVEPPKPAVVLSWAQQLERFWEITDNLPKPLARNTARAHLDRLKGADRTLFRDVYYSLHDALDRVFAVKELYATSRRGGSVERATIVSNYIAEGRATYNNMVAGEDGEIATVSFLAEHDYATFNPFYQWIPADMLHKNLSTM